MTNELLARIGLLEKENAELKKQIEEYEIQNFNLREDVMIKKIAFPNDKIKDKTFYDLYDMPSYEELLNQQEEFIKYLEKEIIDCKAGSGQQYYAQEHLKMFKEIIGNKND